MAETGTPMDAASESVAEALDTPLDNEAMPETGAEALTVDEGGETVHHVEPAALGMTATAWVSLAMIVFLVIIILKKAPAAIMGGLDRKIASIRTQLDEAKQLRAEAEALRGKYEQRLRDADREAEDIRAAAEREAAELVEAAQADTEKLIERRHRMAEEKIAAAERSAIAQLRAKAANAAAKAAESLISERHDETADRKLVDQTIGSLGQKLH